LSDFYSNVVIDGVLFISIKIIGVGVASEVKLIQMASLSSVFLVDFPDLLRKPSNARLKNLLEFFDSVFLNQNIIKVGFDMSIILNTLGVLGVRRSMVNLDIMSFYQGYYNLHMVPFDQYGVLAFEFGQNFRKVRLKEKTRINLKLILLEGSYRLDDIYILAYDIKILQLLYFRLKSYHPNSYRNDYLYYWEWGFLTSRITMTPSYIGNFLNG